MCDSTYLQLPCRVHDLGVSHSGYTSYADYEFPASIFGISPVNEVGNARRVGFWPRCDCTITRGVFWIVDIYSYRGTIYNVDSNYHVTMVENRRTAADNQRTVFVIHPVPIEELVDCRVYDPPRWQIYADGGLVPMVRVGDYKIWSDASDWHAETQYSASIDTWIPWSARCDFCGVGSSDG